jgi:two-component system chemotaxis response regulator CheY
MVRMGVLAQAGSWQKRHDVMLWMSARSYREWKQNMAKVLVVDDAAFMRLVMKEILEKNGHEVVGEAENGAEAVEQYGRLKPDVVTMDITMPVMEGIDAVKLIREMDPKARIIMCSAMGQQQMVVRAIKAGARDFIVKPLQSERVLEAIEKIMAS